MASRSCQMKLNRVCARINERMAHSRNIRKVRAGDGSATRTGLSENESRGVKASLSPAPVPLRKRRLRFGEKWDYAAAPESLLVKIAPRHELFINGRFVAPRTRRYFDS